MQRGRDEPLQTPAEGGLSTAIAITDPSENQSLHIINLVNEITSDLFDCLINALGGNYWR